MTITVGHNARTHTDASAKQCEYGSYAQSYVLDGGMIIHRYIRVPVLAPCLART